MKFHLSLALDHHKTHNGLLSLWNVPETIYTCYSISCWTCKQITLFRSITIFYMPNNILQNIPSFRVNERNIPHNIVSHAEQYYGSVSQQVMPKFLPDHCTTPIFHLLVFDLVSSMAIIRRSLKSSSSLFHIDFVSLTLFPPCSFYSIN